MQQEWDEAGVPILLSLGPIPQDRLGPCQPVPNGGVGELRRMIPQHLAQQLLPQGVILDRELIEAALRAVGPMWVSALTAGYASRTTPHGV